MKTESMFINDAINRFLDVIKLSRSDHTLSTYGNAMKMFTWVLEENDLDPEKTPLSELREDAVSMLITSLRSYAPASESVYIVAVTRFYQFLQAEELSDINLERLKLLVRTRARRPGIRLPQFPKEDIKKLLDYAENLHHLPFEDEREQMRNYRDRAFILSLADTGMRVHEACELRRGDLDWMEYRAVLIGKGNKQAVVRFSSRSINALKEYLNIRATVDSGSNRPLASLPLFIQHSKKAGEKVKPISTFTGRNILHQRVGEVLGEEAVGSITPHSMRHYFVTTVLQASGGNLKLAQELARHSNIQTTQRYAHLSDDELDRGYYEIFEQD
ncbi:MAG: tyrosine-type recombinase/integrase [Anaerolineales bacterium]|nr:tyrosine-type recombinase/integrase [Anaerolineales bacterium]